MNGSTSYLTPSKCIFVLVDPFLFFHEKTVFAKPAIIQAEFK